MLVNILIINKGVKGSISKMLYIPIHWYKLESQFCKRNAITHMELKTREGETGHSARGTTLEVQWKNYLWIFFNSTTVVYRLKIMKYFQMVSYHLTNSYDLNMMWVWREGNSFDLMLSTLRESPEGTPYRI